MRRLSVDMAPNIAVIKLLLPWNASATWENTPALPPMHVPRDPAVAFLTPLLPFSEAFGLVIITGFFKARDLSSILMIATPALSQMRLLLSMLWKPSQPLIV